MKYKDKFEQAIKSSKNSGEPEPVDKGLSNEEILKLVIERAVRNGWDTAKYVSRHKLGDSPTIESNITDEKLWFSGQMYRVIIFSHSFAKTFWGEQRYDGVRAHFGWQSNLKEMVLEPEPLKYLEKFLEVNK